MDNDTGYGGWKYVPLEDHEERQAKAIQERLVREMQEGGYPQVAIDNLRVTFKKATLTISEEERRSGAGHSLADGKPFMRLEIEAKGRTFMDAQHDPAAQVVLYMMQLLRQGSMSMGGPLVLSHDFRGEPIDRRKDLLDMIRIIRPHIVKDAPPAPKP